MTRTRHGHHIRGTEKSDVPTTIARCGGPSRCAECAQDVIDHVTSKAITAGDFKTSFSSDEEGVDYLKQAKRAVVLYVNGGKIEAQDTLTENDVYIVWFCKTLQNWKALVSTILPDGMYYELTYNGDKKELYLDAYSKVDNVVLPMRTRKV